MRASVIVPIYNVEAYLEKCVQSVLAQSAKDFEVLLIDDGSTDRSGALCDRLAESDGRIRVIHQENRGLGGARNTGIREAKGEWLLFVDSDDWLEPWTLEHARTLGEEQNADMVVFGFRSVDENGRTLSTFVEDQPRETVLRLKEHPQLLLIAPSACNKLYRRDLFLRSGVEYPSRVWYEDIRTTQKLLALAGGVVFSDFVGYNYLHRQGSIMNNATLLRNREILDAFDDLLGWFEAHRLFEDYREELCFLTVFHVYLTASCRVIREDRTHPLLREFSEYLTEHFPAYRENRYLSTLSSERRLLLWLLDKKLFALIALLFKLKT